MRILLLDIETSPNTAHVWGLFKQNVSINQLQESSYTMCWAAKWLGEPTVFFDSVFRSRTATMLRGIHKLLDEADAVVHYNGTKFDIPTINKEFLLRGMNPPKPYKQIDLLHIARRKFRFPSNKLDYVAKALWECGKVPHIGHELWVRCMAKDEAAWKEMEKYNKGDVLLLEKVYEALLPWIDSHPNYGLYSNLSKPTCTNCGGTKVQRRGQDRTRSRIYQRYQCQSCGTWLRSSVSSMPEGSKENILVQCH